MATSNLTRRALISAAAAAPVALAAGCASTKTTPTSNTVDKVTYTTGFGTYGREAYAWVAAEKGFFRDNNLDVAIEIGSGGTQNMTKLTKGVTQFSAIDFGAAAYFVATGAAPGLKVFSAVQQRTVTSVITMIRNKISQPRDLAGKTIAAVKGSTVVTMFPGYARLAGLDPTTVKWQYVDTAQLTPLLVSGRVDAIAQYLMGLGSVEQAAGCTGCTTVLPYATYLGDPYGAVLATTSDMIKRKRDVVVRFNNAILKGLEYSARHPHEAGAILHEKVSVSNAAAAEREMQLMAPYVTAGDLPVGSLDRIRMAKAIASLASIGMYPSGLTPEQLVDFSIDSHSTG